MEFVEGPKCPAQLSSITAEWLPNYLPGEEINFYSESGMTGLYFLLLWGKKCPLTTLLCIKKMTPLSHHQGGFTPDTLEVQV